MPHWPKAVWSCNLLIWSIFATDEEHRPPNCLDCETESFVLALQEANEIPQCAGAPENIDGFGIEIRILCEDGFGCWLNGMIWISPSVLVPQILPRVLWEFLLDRRWIPNRWHTCSIVSTLASISTLACHTGKDDRRLRLVGPIEGGEELGFRDLYLLPSVSIAVGKVIGSELLK